MKLFVIEPEVAGEIGERTIYENYDAITTKGERPIISHLHFVFMGWLGDDILEVTVVIRADGVTSLLVCFFF